MLSGIATTLKYGIATGSTSALAFLSTVVIARSLSAADFVAINLVIVAANVSAQLGAGFDSAAARLRARDVVSQRESVVWTRSWRFLLLLGSLPIIYLVCLSDPVPRSTAISLLAFATALVSACALVAVSLGLIEAQSRGFVRQFGLRQLAFYLPFSVALVVAGAIGSLVGGLVCLSVAGVGSLAFSLKRWGSSGALTAPGIDFGTKQYRQLGLTIFSAGACFSLIEKIDVVLAARYFDTEVASTIVIGTRFTVVLALAGSALQTMNISSLGKPKNRKELNSAYAAQWPIFVAFAALVVSVSFVAVAAVGPVFGKQYAIGLLPMFLLSAPFFFYALYSPYVSALASMGERRGLAQSTGAQAGVKLLGVVLAASLGSPTLLYASGLLGAVAGTVAVVLLPYRDRDPQTAHL
jgi:O-antigen/teichoic acid export membrane protein